MSLPCDRQKSPVLPLAEAALRFMRKDRTDDQRNAKTCPCTDLRRCQETATSTAAYYGLREPLRAFWQVTNTSVAAYSPAMSTPVSSIRNLGPAYEASCKAAGIHSAEDLRGLGADEAYGRMLKTGLRPHFIGYYVLVMALQNRPWNDCKGEEKKALRKRFDAIKASSFDAGLDAFEQMMDQIGVRPG